MNHFTKIISKLFLLPFLSIILFSCSKNKNMSAYIPSDSEFVMIINTSAIIEKGGLTELDEFNFFNFIDSSDLSKNEKLTNKINELRASPQDLGISFEQDIYYFQIIDSFGHSYDCYLTDLTDADQFQSQMVTMLKYSHADFATWEENEHHYLKIDYHGCALWDDEKVIFIQSDNGYELDYMYVNIESYLLNIKTENMSSNEVFQDFVFERKDVDLWIRTDFSEILDPYAYKPINLRNDILTVSSEFNSGTINSDYRFFPNDSLKEILDNSSFSGDRFNEELLQFVPQEHAFLLANTLPKDNLVNILEKFNANDDESKQGLYKTLTSKNKKKYIENLNGSYVFSIIDSKEHIETRIQSKPTIFKELRLEKPDYVYLSQLHPLNHYQISDLDEGKLVRVKQKKRRYTPYDNYDIYGDQYIDLSKHLKKDITTEDLIAQNIRVELHGKSIIHGRFDTIDVPIKVPEFILLVEYNDEDIMMEMLRELDSNSSHFNAPEYLPRNSGIGEPINARKNNVLVYTNNQKYLDHFNLGKPLENSMATENMSDIFNTYSFYSRINMTDKLFNLNSRWSKKDYLPNEIINMIESIEMVKSDDYRTQQVINFKHRNYNTAKQIIRLINNSFKKETANDLDHLTEKIQRQRSITDKERTYSRIRRTGEVISWTPIE